MNKIGIGTVSMLNLLCVSIAATIFCVYIRFSFRPRWYPLQWKNHDFECTLLKDFCFTNSC